MSDVDAAYVDESIEAMETEFRLAFIRRLVVLGIVAYGIGFLIGGISGRRTADNRKSTAG